MFKKSYVCGVQKALCEAGMLAYENEAEAAKQASFVASIAFESEDVLSTRPISPEERTEKVAHLLIGANEMNKAAVATAVGGAIGRGVVALGKKLGPLLGRAAGSTARGARVAGEKLWQHKGKALAVGLAVPGAVAVAKQDSQKSKPFGPPKTQLGN